VSLDAGPKILEVIVKGKTLNISTVILSFLLSANAGVGFSQPPRPSRAETGQDQKRKDDGGAIAVVNGTRLITEREIDEAAGPQLYNLQERVYDLRKKTLENLVVQIILKEEAEKRGITEDELKKQLMPDKVDVKQSDIDQRYADNLGTLENMNEDEAKQRIKLDLESRLKLDGYKAALSEIIGRAKIETFLPEPPPPSSTINSEGPSKGPSNAPVTIVEFSDFQCPYCKQAALTLKGLIQDYRSEVRLVFKQMPLSIHPDAFKAAQASVCADGQGRFWEYHNTLFGSSDLSEQALNKYASDLGLKTDEFKTCLASEASAAVVRRDMQQAARADVQGTPTFFVNGRLIRGMKSLDDFRGLIERALSQSRHDGRQTSIR
jgi:predicted DsbA family dithiol-disulfide isomerase